MDQLLQHGLNALILGGTYALLGIGLTLIFGIMRVVNFTHGELYAFGAYMMYMWVMLAGVNFFLALLLAVAARRRAGRADRARAAAPPARRRHRHHHAGDDRRLDRAAERRAARLVRRRQVDQHAVSRPRRWCSGRCRCRGTGCSCSSSRSALIAATYALINRTKLGKAMRATFQDRETAALMGVEIDRIHTATFALGLGPRRRGGRAARARCSSSIRPWATSPRSRPSPSSSSAAWAASPAPPSAASSWRFMEELGAGYVSSGYRDAHGLPAHHRHPALQADGAVRAEGADRVKRALTVAWLAVPGVRAAVAGEPVRPARADHDRHLHHRRDEPQPAARLHRASSASATSPSSASAPTPRAWCRWASRCTCCPIGWCSWSPSRCGSACSAASLAGGRCAAG